MISKWLLALATLIKKFVFIYDRRNLVRLSVSSLFSDNSTTKPFHSHKILAKGSSSV